MVYLYAALGVVMMTGIMAVVEMGLSLTGQSLFLKPDDPYRQNFITNAVGKRDQQMLRLLHDKDDLDFIGRSLQSAQLCDQLLCRSSLAGAAYCRSATTLVPANVVANDAAERLPELAELTRAGVSPHADGFLANACALQVGTHRLLVQPDPIPEDSQIPYRLFSCVLSGDESRCDFESN
ncbi:hypothetical protein Q3Y53_02775 [Synechococcus sp. YX-04-1]|uniref:hypothetical protein n=1 Tax=Synechococcus sp. YX-04-1 TaxID=3062778 RepID=UPI0026E2FB6F|nr:hypothetical protein [Synechococcus sp. YX-04-1]MDO6351457.1 hypothetical protein [Synechococcus sp. YX-04-1]